jgi:diguanylate cyclase (GGDEF)-like protein/PAS domain S-box-containing protein
VGQKKRSCNSRDYDDMAKNLLARKRYEQMLARSATAAICVDENHVIVSWSDTAEELLGYPADYAMGKSLSMIVPADRHCAHRSAFNRAVHTRKTHLSGQSVDVTALHAQGHEIPVELSLSMWLESGKPIFGALIRNNTTRHSAKQRLQNLAHRDPVTLLPNRYAMYEKISIEVLRDPCIILLLDLDDFKHVNDSLGHSVGDQLLAGVAKRLSKAVGNAGFVARLGGDEFAILLSNCENPLVASEVTERIFSSLQLTFDLMGQSIFVGTSIGVAMAPRDADNVEQLLSHADLALYQAKNDGGGKRTFFTRVMHTNAEQKQQLSLDLRQALANDEFELWYQPQFSIDDFQLSGAEALLRWRHPVHGLLLPNIFMDVLNESVIAEEVGGWIINEACSAASEWKQIRQLPLRVAVNLFPAQLRTGRLLQVVSSALSLHGISASELELEITENTVLRNNKRCVKELSKIRGLGVGIAFDDFGTGFASLSLLQEYPLTRLKIDRSFVSRIDRNVGDEAIVRAVIGMAKSLRLNVIAEGVETAAQEASLVGLKCGEVQGFRYGRAMPRAEFASKLVRERCPTALTSR